MIEHTITFYRDLIGVKSASCTCGWFAQVFQQNHAALDHAILTHERTHYDCDESPFTRTNPFGERE
jgi:hypothetical protein